MTWITLASRSLYEYSTIQPIDVPVIETGARAALPIWIDFMNAAFQEEPHQYFDIPDDVSQVRMDPISGLPQPENSKQAVVALFKKGTEPSKFR